MGSLHLPQSGLTAVTLLDNLKFQNIASRPSLALVKGKEQTNYQANWLFLQISSSANLLSEDQHGIPVTVKSVFLFNGMLVCLFDQIPPCKSRD